MTPTELRQLRIAAGITQEHAARVIGYTVGHYSRMERGVSDVPERMADSIRVTLAKEAM